MFLCQIDRSEICESGSNRLFWKYAKTHLKRLTKRMVDYKCLGSKPNKYTGFQTINYCEKLIHDYH